MSSYLQKSLVSLTGLVLFIFVTCVSDTQPVNAQIQVVKAFPNIQFTRPVDLQSPEDGSGRLFVVEQRGVISVFANDSVTSEKQTYLDIPDLVDDRGGRGGVTGVSVPSGVWFQWIFLC